MGYRGMNLQVANPVMAAVQGYKAVDDIFETNRQRQVADEDRQRRIDREAQVQRQNDTLFAQQQEEFGRRQQQWLDEDILKELQPVQMGLEQLKTTNKPGTQGDIDALTAHLSPKALERFRQEMADGKGSLSPYRQASSLLHQAMQKVAEGDGALGKKMAIDAFNMGYGDELNAGSAKDGMEVVSKRVVDLRFYGQGGVVPILEVTARDNTGKEMTYRAPSTKGQGAGAEDKINVIMPEDAARNFDLRAMVADSLDRLLVRHGDKTPLEQAQKRRQGMDMAGAMGGIVGLTEAEQAQVNKIAEGGGDWKAAIELLLEKKKGQKVDLEWRDNVNVGGVPYQIAYDKKTGKEVHRLPMLNDKVHGKKGAGSGAGGGGGELKSHVYSEFNKALMQAMVSKHGIPIPEEAMGFDMSGNERVDVNRYMAQLPPDAQREFLAAMSQGEALMVEGGLSPIRAAQQALLAPMKDRVPLMSTHEGMPDAYLYPRDQAIAAAQQAIAAGKDKKAVTERLEKLYPGAGAELGKQQQATPGASAAGRTPAQVEVPKPAARPGMAMSNRGSLREIQGNINRSGLGDNLINRAGAKHLEMTTRAGKEVINAALVVPRLVARGAESAWVNFVNFSKSRYPSLDELVAFAKENPEEAQKIYEAAAAKK